VNKKQQAFYILEVTIKYFSVEIEDALKIYE